MVISRRRLVALTGVVLSSGLAGCSSEDNDSSNSPSTSGVKDSDGDGVIDSEDYAPRDPSIQERSDLQTPSDNQPTETSVSTETPTSVDDTDTEEEALQEYEAGWNDSESARSLGNSATSAANNEDYPNARRQFNNVIDSSNDAIEHYNTAADLSEQSGHPEAHDIADEAATYMEEIWDQWAEYGLDWVDAKEDGRDEDAERIRNDIEELIQRSEDDSGIEIADTTEFRDALGL